MATVLTEQSTSVYHTPLMLMFMPELYLDRMYASYHVSFDNVTDSKVKRHMA